MVKKLILSVIGILVIIVIVLFLFGNSWLNTLVKRAVETIGPQITGTAVVLDQANISIFTGAGTLTGLRVDNLEGFSDDNIISLGFIEMRVEPRTLFSDPLVVDYLYIAEPDVLVEQARAGNNLQQLLANVRAFAPQTDDQEEDEGAAREVIVRELIIESGRLRGVAFGQAINADLPRIELHEIGTQEGGVPMKQVVELVLGEILRHAGTSLEGLTGDLRQMGRDLEDRGSEALEGGRDEARERIRGLLDR